ncbi:hypothetical protein EDC04DRAFT_2654658 [Pisolithus marmoratus]|nr:hypothetical protein EDC04DRAFT_2654658 [Pisolithus marmoratus]
MEIFEHLLARRSSSWPRRRSQAFPEGDDERTTPQDVARSPESDELTDERKKELEVWDAFKEENHEVLEQLPLSIHRQLKLIRELDAQNEAFYGDLLSSVRKYVELRKYLARQRTETVIDGAVPSVGQSTDSDSPAHVLTNGDAGHTLDSSGGAAELNTPFQPVHGETTQSVLQHIAQVSEESLRAAEEKVSIAQTAHETVDRHIRLLDQAIKEQEAAISLGMRPGTHLAPILLPDIVAVPRWARPSRVEHSPLALTPEPEAAIDDHIVKEIAAVPSASPVSKKSKKIVIHEPEPPTAPVAPATAEAPKTRRGVRLTMPSQPTPEGPPTSIDANEKRYCYCHQVSFGTVGVTIVATDGQANRLTTPTHKMIACDNEGCKLEWFHLGCTGLSDLPGKKSKWYCRECKPKMMQKGRHRS